MEKTEKKANKRLNLCVAAPLVERFQAEVRFLGIGSKIVQAEDGALTSQAELLRQIVNPFILRWLDGQIVEIIDLDEDSGHIPFYLDKQSSGLWSTMLTRGFVSYNQLCETALYHYFKRQEEIANRVRDQVLQLERVILDGDGARLILLMKEFRFGSRNIVSSLGMDTVPCSTEETSGRECDLVAGAERLGG